MPRRARVVDLRSVESADAVSGADVVVVAADDGDRWAAHMRDRAPNAVVVVVGSPAEICQATLFPRARVIGVDDQASADAVVDAVVNDLDKECEVVARCEGERGISGEFARVPAKIGARGIVAILEA